LESAELSRQEVETAIRHPPSAISKLGILLLIFFLTMLQPAYANGGHMHLGGIFFLLLGGLIFIGGFVVVCYLLFRAEPEATREERDDA
jgi:hypothetical protein